MKYNLNPYFAHGPYSIWHPPKGKGVYPSCTVVNKHGITCVNYGGGAVFTSKEHAEEIVEHLNKGN